MSEEDGPGRESDLLPGATDPGIIQFGSKYTDANSRVIAAAEGNARVSMLRLILPLALAASASLASAEDTVLLRPDWDASASQEALTRALGNVDYRVECPVLPPNLDSNMLAARLGGERQVRVTIPRDTTAYREPDLLAGLLVGARDAAWRDCPIHYYFFGDTRIEERIGNIDIYITAGDGLRHAVHVDNYGISGFSLAWDRAAERENAEAEARIEAERQAQEEAERQAEIAAQAYRQQQRAIRRQQSDADAAAFTASVWWWIKFLFWSAVLLFLFLNREHIARWYYSLIPHPVRGQVDAAIHAGAPIDGGLYQELIDSTYGGPIENEVRGQQARDLTARLRRHEAALRSEEEQRVRAARLEAERDAAFMRAHLELLRAGVDHEDAAARLDELKRMTRR